jgi:phospholipase/lecithinase/hemolysin
MSKRSSAITLALAIALVTPAVAKPVDFLFVAGDSLSDPGNVYAATSTAADVLPGIIEPVPPSPPYFEGRFSNGPIWSERLGERFGLGGSDVRNLALGGAKTTGHSALEDAPPLVRPVLEDVGLGGVRQQVDTYLAAGGPVPPDGLYVVWGGANDYLFDEPTTTPAGVPRPVVDLDRTVRDLAEAGAARFLVPNLPDLGRLPNTRDDPEAAELSAATATHNAALAAALAATAERLDVAIEILDVEAYFEQALAGAFGFANVTSPCIGAPSSCGGALFFDGVHPTAAAHAELAEQAYTQLTPVPLPGAVFLFGAALAALGGWSRLRGRDGAHVS